MGPNYITQLIMEDSMVCNHGVSNIFFFHELFLYFLNYLYTNSLFRKGKLTLVTMNFKKNRKKKYFQVTQIILTSDTKSTQDLGRVTYLAQPKPIFFQKSWQAGALMNISSFVELDGKSHVQNQTPKLGPHQGMLTVLMGLALGNISYDMIGQWAHNIHIYQLRFYVKNPHIRYGDKKLRM